MSYQKTKRAERRHHHARVRRAARRKLKASRYSLEAIERLTPRIADNMKACSCAACTVHWASHAQDVADLDAHEQIAQALEAQS